MAIIPESAGPCPRCGCVQKRGPWSEKGAPVCRCTDHEKVASKERLAERHASWGPSPGARFNEWIRCLRRARTSQSLGARTFGTDRGLLARTTETLIRFDCAISAEQARRESRKPVR